MHLLRIQVPDFRVLKDVDITFEREFSPRIFPLGSQNGGGKSTLLQLMFVLSHCPGAPERLPFLRNMLRGFKACEGESRRTLAIMDVWDGEREVRMEFFSCGDSHLGEMGEDADNRLTLSAGAASPKNKPVIRRKKKTATRRTVEERIPKLRRESSELEDNDRQPSSIKKIEDDKERNRQYAVEEVEERISKLGEEISELEDIDRQLRSIKEIEDDKERSRQYVEFILSKDLKRRYDLSDRSTIHECESEVKGELSRLRSEMEEQNERHRSLTSVMSGKVRRHMRSENLTCVAKYSANGDDEERELLICKIENLDANDSQPFLHRLSEKVFLAAPFTQVCLFLPRDVRRLLFGVTAADREEYYTHLKKAKLMLPGFFTYEFFPVAFIVRALRAARDQDTRDLMETGTYGDRFRALLDDLNYVLAGKRIKVEPDLSKVIFEAQKDDGTVELSPEDMSHGELKRLSLHMWIKHHHMADAIVLMDEIEIALHPDWQYEIGRDLMRWAPSNQYVLATHSFDVCEALTPAHVKELEPRLSKRRVSD